MAHGDPGGLQGSGGRGLSGRGGGGHRDPQQGNYPFGDLVNIDVPDLAAGERFYTEAFQLTRGRQLGADFLELLGWPVKVYLLVKAAGTPIGPTAPGVTRAYSRHWTPVHLDVVVDDLDVALERALRAGATLEAAVKTEPYGRLALLGDPFGNGICLLEFNGEGYEAVRTG